MRTKYLVLEVEVGETEVVFLIMYRFVACEKKWKKDCVCFTYQFPLQTTVFTANCGDGDVCCSEWREIKKRKRL